MEWNGIICHLTTHLPIFIIFVVEYAPTHVSTTVQCNCQFCAQLPVRKRLRLTARIQAITWKCISRLESRRQR